MTAIQVLINPAASYVAFSQRVSARSKASERRFSHSKASSDNEVCGQTRVDLTLLITIWQWLLTSASSALQLLPMEQPLAASCALIWRLSETLNAT